MLNDAFREVSGKIPSSVANEALNEEESGSPVLCYTKKTMLNHG